MLFACVTMLFALLLHFKPVWGGALETDCGEDSDRQQERDS